MRYGCKRVTRETDDDTPTTTTTNGIWAWAYKTQYVGVGLDWSFIEACPSHYNVIQHSMWIMSRCGRHSWKLESLGDASAPGRMPYQNCTSVLNLGHLHRRCNRSALASWRMTMTRSVSIKKIAGLSCSNLTEWFSSAHHKDGKLGENGKIVHIRQIIIFWNPPPHLRHHVAMCYVELHMRGQGRPNFTSSASCREEEKS